MNDKQWHIENHIPHGSADGSLRLCRQEQVVASFEDDIGNELVEVVQATLNAREKLMEVAGTVIDLYHRTRDERPDVQLSGGDVLEMLGFVYEDAIEALKCAGEEA